MPRNMSFSKTIAQVQAQTKDVTRRQGWLKLKPGDILNAVEKGMGLKKGEKVNVLTQIRVVSVIREPIQDITKHPGDCEREGFPEMTPYEFVTFYCGFNKCHPEDVCTRIEFEYIEN